MGVDIRRRKPIATFSIVAYDAGSRGRGAEWGVAVQSKFLAVGAVVPWARAGVGAVATQSYCNLMYGPDGLKLMEQGFSAQETVHVLTRADDGREQRQLGIVDAQGLSASFTGSGCHGWAGGIVGDGFAAQGNVLVPGTVEAMAARFEAKRGGEGELADWLVDALAAGQEAGGDSRGRQAAAVLVVRAGGGYGGNNDRYLDLRVDDDPYPIRRLKELVAMHHLYFGVVDPANQTLLADVAGDLQKLLAKTGHYKGPISASFDETTRIALRDLVGQENLEERWNGEGIVIDRLVVDYLMEKFG